MTRHLTNNRDRASKKFIAKHEQLKCDISEAFDYRLEPDSKLDRKRAASQSFRSRGE